MFVSGFTVIRITLVSGNSELPEPDEPDPAPPPAVAAGSPPLPPPAEARYAVTFTSKLNISDALSLNWSVRTPVTSDGLNINLFLLLICLARV